MDIQTSSAALLSRPGIEHAGLPQMNIPWVESPFFNTLLSEQSLSDHDQKLVKDFSENGYIVTDGCFPEIDELASKIIPALEPMYKGRGRIQDAWTVQSEVRAIATNPQVIEVLRLLYQREPIPFQTINFPVGTEQKTHSDTVHFHSVPYRFMCGVWVALEDIDDTSGPLHIYPGSHKLPVWNFHDLGLPSGWEHYVEYEAALQSYVEELGLQKERVLLKKGQALVWAANLLHGGEPILNSKKSRQSQVTHYFFSDCLYYTPLHSDPYIGKVAIRSIQDIRTGKVVPNMYGGKVIGDAPPELPPAMVSTEKQSAMLGSSMDDKEARGILLSVLQKFRS